MGMRAQQRTQNQRDRKNVAWDNQTITTAQGTSKNARSMQSINQPNGSKETTLTQPKASRPPSGRVYVYVASEHENRKTTKPSVAKSSTCNAEQPADDGTGDTE
jgi:hypothetical protein